MLVIYNAWSTYLLLEEQLQKIERCRTIERVYDMQSTWSDKGIVMETAWPRNKTKLSDNVMLSILKNLDTWSLSRVTSIQSKAYGEEW